MQAEQQHCYRRGTGKQPAGQSEQRELAGGDVAIGKTLLNFQRVRSLVRVFEVLIRGNVVVMMVMLILQ